MNWIENVLIIAGVSLDIFAAMECQGALVAKVDKKQLSVICALIAVWQLCALALAGEKDTPFGLAPVTVGALRFQPHCIPGVANVRAGVRLYKSVAGMLGCTGFAVSLLLLS